MALKSVVRNLSLCLLTLGVAAWGQQPLNPADSQFFQNFTNDSINLQNLSVGINVQVIAKPGAMPLAYSLRGLNSCQGAVINGHANVVCGFLNQWAASINCEDSIQCLSLPGANLVGTANSNGNWVLTYTSSTAGTCSDGHGYTKYTGLFVISPVGETYYLPSTDYVEVEVGGTTCNHAVSDYTLSGGVKIIASAIGTSGQVVFPNGVSISSNTGTDPFGNTIRAVLSPPTLTYTDTLGNNTFVVTAGGGSSGEIDTYKDTGGTSRQIKQILTSETAKTTFGCSQWPDQTISGRYATTEIDYPDGNNLYLSYESVAGGITGRIHQVTYRTGGTATYTYGTMNCQSMIPSSLTRTTADGTTTYTFKPIPGSGGKFGTETDVYDPGMNETTYVFMGTDSNGAPIEGVPITLASVQVWQNIGTVASPNYTLLSTTTYCYNGNSSLCYQTQASYPIVEKDTYYTLGTKASMSRVQELYDHGCGGTCGNVTSISRYDFTGWGTGTPDNTTTITYSGCGAGSTIINKPCDVKTTDAASHTLAETKYTYSSKGFTTQVQRWNGTASLWITSSASPNTNGTAASSTSPLGITTTYSYADCNAMLPTGSSKTVNGVTLTTGASWDCNMGKLISSTDANTNTSNFTYDELGRPHSQADPLTYTLTEDYPSATTNTLTDSTYFTTTTEVNGLGRPIRSQTTDGASYDTVSSAYAFSGTQWQISKSQPCIAALNADCTKNHFLTIDSLGRNITSSTTSNETVTTAFNWNDVSSTLSPFPSGEHNKIRQLEYDGLGRVTSVCAVETTGGSACNQVDGNSGIVNNFTYSYNANGSTNVVNVRGGQNHTDVIDTLGRDYSVFRPEHGTITYTFDKTSVADVCRGSGVTLQGLLLKKTNNDGSYECYQYDPDGKLTDVAIANGSGVAQPECRRFRYDATSNGIYTAPTGYTAGNIKGRVMEASTDDCTYPFSQAHMISDEWFSYDADGRTTETWETTPHSSGWYHTTAGYALNGQFTSLSGVPGKSTYTITLDPNGRPDSSKYGTTVVGSNATYNAAGQATEIDFEGSDKDVYTYDANTGLMKTWAFTVGSSSESATLTWNANHTLKTLAITDGFNAGGTQTCHYNPTDSAGTGYDDVGRLVGVNCGTPWNQTYTYDQYDNFSKSGTTNWNPTYNSANNFITGGGYDGTGRVTYDLNNSYGWDVYGKMITANSGASLGSCGAAGVSCFTYDAFGRAVEKNVAGTITEYLYSPIGLTGVMSGQTTNDLRLPVPGGSLIDVKPASTNLFHFDWLGSARVISTLSGHTVATDVAYTPYGERYAWFGSAGFFNFTGDFQDLYSGGNHYDTPNRQFDAGSGSRWLSSDPARASWNAYAYPTNPNSFTDPSGLACYPIEMKMFGTCAPFMNNGVNISWNEFDVMNIPVVGGTEFGPIATLNSNAPLQVPLDTAVIDGQGNVSFTPDDPSGNLAIDSQLTIQGWYNPIISTGLSIVTWPSLTPLHPLMPTIRAYDPNIFQRILDRMNAWDYEHQKLIGVVGCLTAPPGAMQEIQAAKNMLMNGGSPPLNSDSEQGGAGGGTIWINNINTQSNGGQSPYGSVQGAATANAVGLATDYVGSALPCIAKQ